MHKALVRFRGDYGTPLRWMVVQVSLISWRARNVHVQPKPMRPSSPTVDLRIDVGLTTLGSVSYGWPLGN